MKKHTTNIIHAKRQSEQGFTIVETIVTLVVVAMFLTAFLEGYLLLMSQRSTVVIQSKADGIARADLQRVVSAPQPQVACPTTGAGLDLTDGSSVANPITIDSTSTNARIQALGANSSEQLLLYCITDASGPKRVVAKVTYVVNGTNRTIVYAKIFN